MYHFCVLHLDYPIWTYPGTAQDQGYRRHASELVCIYATYQYSTKHAGCEALSAVSVYTDAFVSGLDLDPNEHTSYLLIIYLCILINMYRINIMRYITWYRYRDTPNILSTLISIYPENIAWYIENSWYDTEHYSNSKQFRIHTWGYASLPPSWIEKGLLLLYL